MRSLLALLCSFFILPQTLAAKSFEAQYWLTSHGTRVVFYQAMEVPMLDISIAFAAGSAYDGEHFGLSALTTELLNQGNAGLDANTIAEKLAETGAQYEGESSRDMAVLNLKTLTDPKSLNAASDIFALIVNHPDFPLQAFEREKNQQLMAIAQAQESPEEIANQTFFKALYGDHPYAHPINGTQDRVKALTIEQVHRFYQQFFVNRNAVIVMVGAIDKSTAQQLAEKLTKDLPEGEAAATIPRAHSLPEELNIEVQFPSSQSVIRLGQLGIEHHNKNYFPLMVGNHILGGGTLVSQLGDEVRQKRGLTYGIYSQFIPMPALGPFIISLSTQNKQAAMAIDVTRKTLEAYLKAGPSEEELTAAKQYLIGSFPLSLASNRSIANMLLKIAFYHLPENYLDTYTAQIEKVTTTQIKEAFAQLITPNKLLQVTVGNT
ncbi:M16 family metallopeptidase [Legionella oakridgensis]|uniref:Zinc protease (Peptidase, M16 family) n=2 Tax=Legionella oakridgensis TaxID=29423 RepID=A0A0W0X4W2_9GAMM|nr:pitrilysin family protein [Legionella oakridgensis]AHE68196.1 putative Zn-dependent peptidase [Legionella oakridgensis ATCC 33761 = DSM 21215]KTD39607.1 zinc protease (peptidase, M16 family) [Legionella oakridgensis]STY21157.1 zinc protease (peptidase, M16 family) [Legionella longbeachae]